MKTLNNSEKNILVLQKYFLCIACICFVLPQVNAAYFVDNFSNGAVADSDGYTGFWTKHTETAQGSITENNGNDNMIQFKIGSGNSTNQNASIYSGIESNFNFFTNTGVMFKWRRIEMSGTAAAVNKIIWLDLVSESGSTKTFDNSNDGVRVEITGSGSVKLKFKVNNSVVTKATYNSSNIPDFIRLKLNKKNASSVAYQLKIYYSQVGSIITKSGSHSLNTSKWGNGGNASMHLTARRQGNTSGTFLLKMTDMYAHDDTEAYTGDLFEQIDTPPPGVSANNSFYKKGLLNVRQAPYNAAGNGIADDTAKIQRAIIDAYEHDLACYIPHGTYKISKQLRVMNKVSLLDNTIDEGGGNKRVVGSKRKKTNIIVGEKMNASGKRPLLQFDSEATLPAGNALLHFWSQRYKQGNNVATDNPSDNQGNVGFNIVIKGFDIDVTGQSGAYGLQGVVAQGSSVQDMKITATGAKAGIHNMLGVAGGYFNIEIVGGEYGIHVPDAGSETSEYPQIYGLKLTGQTNKSILHNGLGGLVIAGLEIKKNNGPAMELKKKSNLAPGSISIIDGIIEFTNPNQNEAISNNTINNGCRSLYLRNVYIKNAKKVSRTTNAKGNGWALVKEYGFTGFNNSNSTECRAIIEKIPYGKEEAVGVDTDLTISASEVPDDLITRHLWNEQSFPSFEDSDAVDVKEDLGVVGNGIADDTNALQAAIANHDKIFLPKGIYMLKQPLELRKRTQLFGVGLTLAMLRPVDDGTWSVGAPVIKTKNDTQGDFTTTLAFVCFNFNKTAKNAAIHWRAGEQSMVRGFHIGQSENLYGNPVSVNMQSIKVTAGGGGRWWATAPCEAQTALLSGHNNYRLYLVDGTTAPLSFYGMNVERQASEPMSEVRNASNVFIYCYKGENHTGKAHRQTLLQVKDSDNVMLLGYSGIAQSDAGNKQLFKFVNSTNILAANLLPQKKHFSNPGDTIAMHTGSTEHKIKYDDGCTLLRDGNPTLLVHSNAESPPPPPSNASPVLSAISNQSVNEGSTLTVNISAADSNGDAISLSASGVPWYGSLTDNGDGTGNIVFSPNYNSSGSKTITVTADDGNVGVDTEVFTLTINNVNRVPAVSSISNVGIDENETTQIGFSATDADGDAVIFSSSALPSFCNLVDNGDGSGSISVSSDYTSSGVYPITVTANDGNGGTDSSSFTLTVNNVNRAPVLSTVASAPLQVVEGEVLTVDVNASDPDGDSLTLTVSGVSFATTSMSGGVGTITFSPAAGHACVYHPIIVTVDDGNATANTDSEQITLDVVASEPPFLAYENDFTLGNTSDDFVGSTLDFSIAEGEMSSNTFGVWRTAHVSSENVPDNLENFKIVARMKSESVSNAWEGAAVRFRDIDSGNWYSLQVRSNPEGDDVRVFGKENNSAVTVKQWNTGIDPNTWNTFSIVVTGQNVDVFYGNEFLSNAAIPNHSCVVNHLSGKIGLRQRANNAQWDYIRVVALGEPDYIEDFDDGEAQDWVFDASHFQVSNGIFAQLAGAAWTNANYNAVVSVDSNFSLSVEGRTVGTRTKNFESPNLVLKYKDNANWIALSVEQNVNTGVRNLRLKKKVAGTATETIIASGISALDNVSDWHAIDAQVNADKITVWINGIPVVSDHSEPDIDNLIIFDESTTFGVKSTTGSVTIEYDNFKFYDEYNLN